jgi:hypothetical protein
MRTITVVSFALAMSVGCQSAAPAPSAEPPPAAAGTSGTSEPAPSTPAKIDAAAVEAVMKAKPETSDGVVKVSFPRDDVKVDVDGWAMPPFMGLTSWIAFTPGEKPGVEAMAMGDLVLFEDEVTDVMRTLLARGVHVTALHNHFVFDKPKVYFLHLEGEGTLDAVARGARAALDASKAIRAKSREPRDRFEGKPVPAKSAIDPAKIEAVLGLRPATKDGMAKVVVGRSASVKAACGCTIGKAMGVNTWAAFAGTDDDAVVDGDFAVTEDELQPVLEKLTSSGVHVVAIHHHMVGEQPRILFLHYWGRGTSDALARAVKEALGVTKAGK